MPEFADNWQVVMLKNNDDSSDRLVSLALGFEEGAADPRGRAVAVFYDWQELSRMIYAVFEAAVDAWGPPPEVMSDLFDHQTEH